MHIEFSWLGLGVVVHGATFGLKPLFYGMQMVYAHDHLVLLNLICKFWSFICLILWFSIIPLSIMLTVMVVILDLINQLKWIIIFFPITGWAEGDTSCSCKRQSWSCWDSLSPHITHPICSRMDYWWNNWTYAVWNGQTTGIRAWI